MLKINEVIEWNGRKIKCVESINKGSCIGCTFYDNNGECASSGELFWGCKTPDVIFIDVTEEKE